MSGSKTARRRSRLLALVVGAASPEIVHATVSAGATPAVSTPTVTYVLSLDDNGSGGYVNGDFAVYAIDSTSDGNTGLASYDLSVANASTINNVSPRGSYDDGTGNSTSDSLGFTLLRSAANTSPVTGSQDTVDYPSGVILVRGFGQTAGNLANDAAPGSTGAVGTPTQPSYGAALLIAKGTYKGLAPSFSNTADDTANVFINSTGISTEPTTLAFSPGGTGASFYWKSGVTSGNWSTAGNWSATGSNGTDNAGPPGEGAEVEIIHDDTINRVVSLDENSVLYSLEFGNGGGGTSTLLQTSGFDLIVAGYGENIDGGGVHTQSAGANWISGGLWVGNEGPGAPGTYNLSGGIITVRGTLEDQGVVVGYSGSSGGVFNQSGGVINVGADEMIGVGGAGTFTQNGGSQFIGAASSPQLLQIGNFPNSAGDFSLSGTGVLTVNGSVCVGYGTIVGPETGTLTVSGGTMSVTNGLIVAPAEALFQSGGTITAGSISIGSGATIRFTGGTLNIGAGTFGTASAVVVGNGSAPAMLHLTGGGSGSSYTFVKGLSVSTAATLTGGGTINTAPFTVYGTIAPLASENSITVAGPCTLEPSATTLIQCIGSTPRFGSVSSNGNMALAGVLAIYEDTANEAITTSTQSFVILRATGTGLLSGAFSNIASGQTLTTTDGSATFLVTINEGADGDVVLSDFQAVPEPGMVGVLGLGGVVIMRRRRGRVEFD